MPNESIKLNSAGRRAIVYRNQLLPLSETFVRDQLLALRRWDAVLVGETMVEPRPDLAGVTCRAVFESGRLGLARQKLDHLLERAIGRSRALASVIRAIEPAMLHVHFATDAVRIWPTVRAMDLPMLVTLHGFDIQTHARWWRAGNGGSDMRDYPDRLLAMARDPRVRFIAVSGAVQRAALAYGIPADRVKVRHIGVDTARFAPGPLPMSQRARDILFVGRMVEKKGATYLIEAVARIQQRIPGMRLLMLGDGPERRALEAQAKDLGVEALFLGSQTHAQVLDRFRAARVFCLPSITAENGDAEGLPIVILEAQSFGVPVVSSATAAGEEALLNTVTGFAFAERDVEMLAEHLETLLTDDAKAEAMSKAAVAFARERFDLATCTIALEDMYDDVAGLS